MNRALLWIILAIAIVLGILWQFYPLPDAKDRMDSLPLLGQGYVGEVLPLQDWEAAFFKNVGVLKRAYKVKDRSLFLTALDGTRDRHAVHDPLYCFRGAGWEVASQEPTPIPGGTAVLVKLKKGAEREEALYWFGDGTHHYDSPYRYWWQTSLRRLTLGKSGPEPILITIQPLDNKPIDMKTLFETFPDLQKL